MSSRSNISTFFQPIGEASASATLFGNVYKNQLWVNISALTDFEIRSLPLAVEDNMLLLQVSALSKVGIASVRQGYTTTLGSCSEMDAWATWLRPMGLHLVQGC